MEVRIHREGERIAIPAYLGRLFDCERVRLTILEDGIVAVSRAGSEDHSWDTRSLVRQATSHAKLVNWKKWAVDSGLRSVVEEADREGDLRLPVVEDEAGQVKAIEVPHRAPAVFGFRVWEDEE